MQSIEDTRRRNLALLVAQYGSQVALAEALGHSGTSHLSLTLAGKKPFTERSARTFEKTLKLSPGWLDRNREGVPEKVELDEKLLTQVISAVNDAAQGSAINSGKLSAIVVEVYLRAIKDGQVDALQVRRLIELSK